MHNVQHDCVKMIRVQYNSVCNAVVWAMHYVCNIVVCAICNIIVCKQNCR